MKCINIIAATVLLGGLVACQTNSFYWKEGTQIISRCDEGVLNTIMLKDSVTNTVMHIQRLGNGLHEMDLTSNLPGYSLSILHNGEQKRVDQFRLRPNTQYEISHSAPNDAVIVRFKIATDEAGKIKYASKITCD